MSKEQIENNVIKDFLEEIIGQQKMMAKRIKKLEKRPHNMSNAEFVALDDVLEVIKASDQDKETKQSVRKFYFWCTGVFLLVCVICFVCHKVSIYNTKERFRIFEPYLRSGLMLEELEKNPKTKAKIKEIERKIAESGKQTNN